MILIKQTQDKWALHFGFLWEVEDEIAEQKNFFHTYAEAIDYLSTLNY
jgi:hypothetical protein